MASKRGQISVFIIIGVVLIAALGLFLYLKSSVVKEGVEPVPNDISGVKLYVDKCFESVAKDAVLYVAYHGGYYHLPERTGSFRDINNDPEIAGTLISVPYYVYEGEVLVPTKEDIEKELSDYISLNLPTCINVDEFTEKGFEVEFGTPNITSTIGEKEVFFDANFPITFSLEETSQTISGFATSFDANLLKLYNIAGEYARYQKQDPDVFFVSKINDLALENQVFFRNLNFFNGDIMVTILDNSSTINNKPLIFAFAIKYPPFDPKAGIAEKFGGESAENMLSFSTTAQAAG